MPTQLQQGPSPVRLLWHDSTYFGITVHMGIFNLADGYSCSGRTQLAKASDDCILPQF